MHTALKVQTVEQQRVPTSVEPRLPDRVRDCERRAAEARLRATRVTDPAYQSELLALALQYEAIAMSFRELHVSFAELGVL